MLKTIPEEIYSYCEQKFGQLKQFLPASGGCINHGGRLKTTEGTFFIKWNDAGRYPNMFTAEAKGLKYLREPNCIPVPQHIDVYEGDQYACLVLENIEERPRTSDFWEAFGVNLANLHRQSNNQYGLDHHNYMGSLKQHNDPYSDWIDFFIHCRLDPQIELARKAGKMDSHGLSAFDQLKKRLDDLLAIEPPALVHGDLWSGNFMVNREGMATLIDPAVAFAHREIDLAMTRLFGGFDTKFYEAYQEAFPLQPGYEERFEIYNLYPLLVHVNLFGGGYYQQVLHILNRYT
ncbi:MAG: fructosamine kinase family protein [Fulvivirga sp.]|nr:fructosamine kinase family protein [Fulvivirga sp.]